MTFHQGLYLTLFFNNNRNSSVYSTLLAYVKWKDFDGIVSFELSIAYRVKKVLFFFFSVTVQF